EPVEGVVEAVPVGVHHELAILAIDLAVNDDLRARSVVVVDVVRGVLEVPTDLAVAHAKRHGGVGVEIVPWPRAGVVARHRVAGSPKGSFGCRYGRSR